ncbi:cation:proton antiporter [Dyadobacter sp. CY345]|uniref:cation:proton antiporter domain-containing protein n=1 Tax=Dyadobacter sp. CY345 TaxID=2909335 RepID=UPI001F3BC1DD|nr:cation:proton antiporter [Dyadobacter sp. CY345]MCF2443180.1 cation:proton antiporter [Dyadobacter sp. CY345]
MKNIRNLLFYLFTIGLFSGLMYFIIVHGETLEIGKVTVKKVANSTSSWQQFIDTYQQNITSPLAILLLQIITIIVVARAFGYLCKKIKQPTVIGEIAAGIFLGPSFIGMYYPEFSSFLFPLKSLGNLQFLSQIGLILFMFVIGMELDLKILKNKAQEAIVVSHASIIFPFALGIGLAFVIYERFAPAEVNFLSFALFTGIALSITAFPVLARIVQERGLSKTKLGTLAITCAATDDITAWCLLAAVIAIVKAGSVFSAIYTILMAGSYVLIMLKIVQPFLKKLGDVYSYKEGLTKPVVAVFFITLLVSSYATEVIGIHALFGAFMAGVIMPANQTFRNIFIEKVEDVALVLLLPLFFVFTGLRTQIGLLNDPYLWQITGLIVTAAVIGKFAGSTIAAKFVGQDWRDSLVLGALMNTRGLMELVVLNIGYDLGVLTPEIFAMMVIMALVTTCMTGPALDLINRFFPEKNIDLPDSIVETGKYTILVSFGSPQSGRSMLRLAHSFIRKAPSNASITALHLSPSNDLNQFNSDEYEHDSFEPIRQEAQQLNLPMITMFKPSQDIDRDIIDTANLGNFDLLLVGIGRNVFEGTILGKVLGFTTKIISPERIYDTITGKEKFFDYSVFDDRTKHIIKSVKVPVGILVEKNLAKIENIFIPIFSLSDSFLLVFAQKLIHHSDARVIILDASGVIRQNPELKETISAIEQIAPNHIALYNEKKIEKEFLEQQDLMLISLDSWKKAVESHSLWLSYSPSVLMIRS